MEPEEQKVFFLNLAKKFRKENDLSDLTWALCESSKTFKKLFLSFFFEEITDISGISLQREYCKGDSRPDFYFEYNNREYVIEIKKQDFNNHFEQYKTAFNGSRFGWIAIYKVAPQEGIEIRTWQELNQFLEEKIETQAIAGGAQTAIESYCMLIQNVCLLFKLKKMKLDDLPSLLNFYRLIDKIIETPIAGITFSIYTQSKGITEDRSGKHLKLTKIGRPEIVLYPWFGVYYDAIKACICIGFARNWCTAIFNGIQGSAKSDGKLYAAPYVEDHGYWFELRPELFQRFNEVDTSVEEQEKMLTEFFCEVMIHVSQYLD